MKLSSCTLCHLSETRKKVVIARGMDTSGVMIVGEAPGQEENAAGKPFIGKAGKILSKWLESTRQPATSSTRFSGSNPLDSPAEEDFYITNVVKCWPPDENGGNRAPTPDEIQACSGWLDKEIKRVNPWLIVALGSTSVGRLTGDATLGDRVGTLEWNAIYNVPILLTYHPAFIARSSPQGIKAYERDFDFIARAVSMKRWEWHMLMKEVKDHGSLKIATDD